MLIDWFTVAAQVVNFLILVWLLKRFLYAPVLNAIDAREKRIASQIQQAAAEQTKAEAERASYEAKNRELGAEREQLLASARKSAEEERTTLLQQARTEHEQLRERLAAELSEQRDDMTHAIVSRVESELFETARRLVAELSDRNLEEAIVAVFLRRLHSLGEADRANLRGRSATGTATSGSPVTVRTAFELSPAQRSAIEAELKQITHDEAPPRYEQAPELIGGLELLANGHRLSWSAEDYLASLNQKVSEALKSAAES